MEPHPVVRAGQVWPTLEALQASPEDGVPQGPGWAQGPVRPPLTVIEDVVAHKSLAGQGTEGLTGPNPKVPPKGLSSVAFEHFLAVFF